jgi:DNA-binding NarL/FixJ family response regulator
MSRIQIGIISKSRLLRESLGHFLERKLGAQGCPPDGLFSGSPLNGDAARRVLLVDVRGADLPTLDFVRKTLRADANGKVIFLGMPADKCLLIETLRWGVSGYVMGEAGTSEVVKAIRLVNHGHGPCPPELFEFLLQHVAEACIESANSGGLMVANAR